MHYTTVRNVALNTSQNHYNMDIKVLTEFRPIVRNDGRGNDGDRNLFSTRGSCVPASRNLVLSLDNSNL